MKIYNTDEGKYIVKFRISPYGNVGLYQQLHHGIKVNVWEH